MKQTLLTLTFAITFASLKGQFTMCSGTNSTSLSSGTIYDSGGPSGNYSAYENCFFLIKPNCPGSITLNFSSFDTEVNYDYVRVYDGPSTSSPLLGGYWGTGTVPPMTATSGTMLIQFYSDSGYNLSGFAASWTTSNPGCPPVANFSFTANSCQGKVNFFDGSQNSPTTRLWNFGDGNGSSLPNPVHTYTAPGNYAVTLIATNSFGSHTVTKYVSVNPVLFEIGYNGTPLLNVPVSFTTDYTSGQVYTWSFGDGGFAGSANAIHSYSNMGTYNAALTIATGTCVATRTMQVKVNDAVGISEFQGAPYQANIQPNPFQGSSVLNLQLAKDSRIRIEVINQLGQLIQVVADQELITGEYRFDLQGIPAGVHYLKIQEGNRSRTLKIVSLD